VKLDIVASSVSHVFLSSSQWSDDKCALSRIEYRYPRCCVIENLLASLTDRSVTHDRVTMPHGAHLHLQHHSYLMLSIWIVSAPNVAPNTNKTDRSCVIPNVLRSPLAHLIQALRPRLRASGLARPKCLQQQPLVLTSLRDRVSCWFSSISVWMR
jgi:hypothetical protein